VVLIKNWSEEVEDAGCKTHDGLGFGGGIGALCFGAIGERADAFTETLKQTSIFYNVPGGQMVLVPSGNELANSPQAMKPKSMRYDANTKIWGLQPSEPPAGLVQVTRGGMIDKNFYYYGNTGAGKVRSMLVDPKTGLVHYLVIEGVALGNENYLPVPVSAVDLDSGDMAASTPELKLMSFFGSGELGKAYPKQELAIPLLMTTVVMLPGHALPK